MKRLPDSEFEIMNAVWDSAPPIRSSLIMEKVGKSKNWNIAPLITMMNRLVDKGFLSTEKIGRDRVYYPIVSREDYRAFEAKSCLKYHDNSPLQLFDSLYNGRQLSEEDLNELIAWAQKKRG